MYVEKLANGKYKFVEKYKENLTNKWKRVSITSDKNTKAIQKEMQLKLLNKIKQKQQSNHYASESISVSMLCDLFIEDYATRVAINTLRAAKSHINKLDKRIKSTMTDKLTTALFNKELLRLKHENKARGTIVNTYSIMLQILKYGLKYGYISDRELLNIELPDLPKKQKDDWKYLEKDELQHVLNLIEDERIRDILSFQVMTGMRISEVLGLSLDELDLENKIINIKHQAIRSNTTSLPKNKQERSIFINDECIDIINKYKNHTYYFIFLNSRGNTFTQGEINRYLSNIDFNLNKKITTHIFRHTFITRMIENNIQAEIIARHVGHSNTEMINRVYGHFTDKMTKRMQNMIDSVSIL